jgi:hypothetical protein
LTVSSAARVQDEASFVKCAFISGALSASAKRAHSAARFRHWCLFMTGSLAVRRSPGNTRYAPGLLSHRELRGGERWGRGTTQADRSATRCVPVKFLSSTQGSLRSCRARTQSHLMFFALHPILIPASRQISSDWWPVAVQIHRQHRRLLRARNRDTRLFSSEGQLWRKREGV